MGDHGFVAPISKAYPFVRITLWPRESIFRRDGFLYAARLWDAPTGQPRATIPHGIRAVFSPDGKTVATAGADSTVRLWDATTGQSRATLTHLFSQVLAFSPDGKYLLVATGSEAQFYLLRTQDLVQAACAYLPGNLTRGQWQQYLPDEPYRKTCANLP